MRYKADFHPSELLCMRTYAWVPLPVALPALKADSHCAIGLVSTPALCQQMRLEMIPLDIPGHGRLFLTVPPSALMYVHAGAGQPTATILCSFTPKNVCTCPGLRIQEAS